MTAGASVHVRPLDQKFAKVAALMRSTEHQGERDAAKMKATALAAAAGMTLDEALAASAPKPAPKPFNFFHGYDDWMEEREPGHKARCAAKKRERHQAWQSRRAAILARYGIAKVATAPCERERLILAAVAPWRKVSRNGRWTDALDGWKGNFLNWEEGPSHVLDAIRGAYPLPSTFAAAKAEHDYWTMRNAELDDVGAGADGPIGDIVLDTPAMIRWELVRPLAEHELPTTTLADLHARFAIYQDMDAGHTRVRDALFRDLTALVEDDRQAVSATVEAAPPHAEGSAPSVHDGGQIADLIRQHPDWSDRRLARAAGCSPTTVGKTRRAIGATSVKRSVQRGGQTYSFNVGERPAAAPASASEVIDHA